MNNDSTPQNQKIEIELDYEEIGQFFRYIREYGNFSQNEVAEFMGRITSHVSHLENASRKIKFEDIKAISAFFGMDVCLTFSVVGDREPVKLPSYKTLMKLIDALQALESEVK